MIAWSGISQALVETRLELGSAEDRNNCNHAWVFLDKNIDGDVWHCWVAQEKRYQVNQILQECPAAQIVRYGNRLSGKWEWSDYTDTRADAIRADIEASGMSGNLAALVRSFAKSIEDDENAEE